MTNIDQVTGTQCPNCRQPMQSQELERHDSGIVQIDLCYGCAGIWFDKLESIQLAPSAVIELFREIQSHADMPRQPVAQQLACPRCTHALTLSFDLGKAGRFSYFRCVTGDGRFTPFFQFLREKQFVRSLTEPELARVRSQVRQIRCSECGAPVDLENETQCRYCHAPVSFLDPDAVQKAAAMWSAAEHQRTLAPTPGAIADVLLTFTPHPSPPSGASPGGLGSLAELGLNGASLGVDLVAMGIHAIGSLFARHD